MSWVERVPAIAPCRTCRKVLPGQTTIERHPWQPDSEHRRYHFCDLCLGRMMSMPEKPLEVVIQEQFGGVST